MHEYVTKAFILSTEPAGEANLRITMFTQSSGKVVALARSARKPKAKLTAHLQPLSISRVRLVERKGVQVVDAMRVSELSESSESASTSVDWASKMIALLGVAQLIDKMTDLYHPDPELWALIENGALASASTLKILGFDPAHARCRFCDGGKPSHFLIKDSEFVCNSCFTASLKAEHKERVVVQ